MPRTITVAALQTSYGHDLADNIANTADLVRQAAAQGAQVILPSELFQGPYFCVAQDERWFAHDSQCWVAGWISSIRHRTKKRLKRCLIMAGCLPKIVLVQSQTLTTFLPATALLQD